LSLIPGNNLPESDIEYIDIFVHFMMYGTWILILFTEMRKQYSSPNFRYYVKASMLFVLFGSVMEVLQESLVPGRFGAWSDFIANSTGCFFGLVLIYLMFSRNQKQI